MPWQTPSPSTWWTTRGSDRRKYRVMHRRTLLHTLYPQPGARSSTLLSTPHRTYPHCYPQQKCICCVRQVRPSPGDKRRFDLRRCGAGPLSGPSSPVPDISPVRRDRRLGSRGFRRLSTLLCTLCTTTTDPRETSSYRRTVARFLVLRGVLRRPSFSTQPQEMLSLRGFL